MNFAVFSLRVCQLGPDLGLHLSVKAYQPMRGGGGAMAMALTMFMRFYILGQCLRFAQYLFKCSTSSHECGTSVTLNIVRFF